MKKTIAFAILFLLLLSACSTAQLSTRETPRNIKQIKWKYGFIDKTGRFVIEPEYDLAWPFSEGLASVLIGKRWGYIDKTGKVVIQPGFYKAFPFSEGMAVVGVDRKGNSYIDKNGKIAINEYDVEKLEYYFVYYENGTQRIDTARIKRIYEAWPFSEGLARVKLDVNIYRKEEFYTSIELYGFIDRTGKIKIVPIFNNARDFSENMAAVQVGKRFGCNLFEDWGYIDKNFRYGLDKDLNKGGRSAFIYAIKCQYYKAYDFSNGVAEVTLYDNKKYKMRNNKFIFMKGETIWTSSEVREREFDKGKSFKEGLAAVKVSNKYGYIDTKGDMLIQPQYKTAKDFSEGLAAVEVDGVWGYIDKSGRVVISPQFSLAFQFSEGLAGVKVGNAWSFIDKSGKIVIQLPPEFKIASYESRPDVRLPSYEGGFREGLAMVGVPYRE